MRKLLYLNEFSKRIYKYTSIEDIARLTAFIIQRIFNIKCFAFFLKEEKKLVPIFIDNKLKKFDFGLLAEYQKLLSKTDESFVVSINGIDKKHLFFKLLSELNADSIIIKQFTCFENTKVVLCFVGESDNIGDLEYLESFLNVAKLRIDYVFSVEKTKQALNNTNKLLNNTLKVLSNLAEIRDFYTKGHMQRVAHYSKNIALDLGLTNVDIIDKAALLHDIGKVGIPDAILLKPFKLSEQEYAFIKKHPEFSKFILDNIEGFEDIINIIASHHEYLDGSGYPKGSKGDEISIETRILTIADIFDALTTDRPYRKALSFSQAINIMTSEFETKLDMDILHKSIEVLKESVKTAREIGLSGEHIDTMRNMVFYIDYETGFYSKYYLPKFAHNLSEDVVVVLLDLRDMRTINIEYSRSIGDALIKSFSLLIRDAFAQLNSEFFRIGGDSFIVVIKNLELDVLPNYILELDKSFKDANKSLNPSFWFACCKHKKQDDINETLQTLTKKIFYKRRVS